MSKLRPFCMPKWGIEMTEGTVAEWMVTEGARVSRGDVICLIETAKITNEVEAEGDDVILRIVAPSGDAALPVGTLLAVLGEAGATTSEVDAFVAGFMPSESGIGDAQADNQMVASGALKSVPTKIETNRPISPKALDLAQREAVDLVGIEGSGRGGRITYQDVYRYLQPATAQAWRGPLETPPSDLKVFASPLARRLATIHGVNLANLSGTGPRGRISKHDVLAASKAGAHEERTFAVTANDARVEPFDKVRAVIAARLTAAKRDIPHFYLRVAVEVDALIALRKTANLVLGIKASLNDYILMAVAKALARHSEVNVQLHGDAIHHFPHADVAIAVASPKGLVTPIVRQADRMTIGQIAVATAQLIEKSKIGKLNYSDLDGGTFTVSNLGMYGIDEFDAVINPPQGAILAVGRAQREVVELAGGDLGAVSKIRLVLSVDHRAIDGAAGAQFLATLKALLEEPEALFA